jgi:CheY-like chemotaxis protein
MVLRVLIAEDEALIALSLTDLLEAEGYRVDVAPDGAAALTMASGMGSALDLLVTDLNMPHLCGEDLIRALRAIRPELPVVVVTGSPPRGGEAALRRYVGGHGPMTLLDKPLIYDALFAAVREAGDVSLRRSSSKHGQVPQDSPGWRMAAEWLPSLG